MSQIQQRVETLLNGKQYLVVDSSKRVTGTAEDFVIELPNILTNVKSIEPRYAIMTNSVYNVTGVNNVFAITRSGVDVAVGISAGSYTIEELIDELNTVWNPNNLQFVYDAKTLKVTIEEETSTPFFINKQLSTISQIIGFTTAYNFDSEQVIHGSNGIVKLSNLYDYIHINMDIVEQYYGSELRNYLISYPLQSVDFGKSQLVNFPDSLPIIASKSFFQSIHIWLSDKAFNPIDNNQSDFIILLEVYFI